MSVTIENAWWFYGGLWQDPDLKKVKSSWLQYVPRPIDPGECTSQGVITLRGPRRAGKTVALKLLVAELVTKRGWRGRDIVWTSFDTFRTLSQVEEHLVDLQARHQPKLIVVDEATSVVGWQRVIKKLRDDGTLAAATIILTGSSAFDLKSGVERMAGRRGNVLFPDRTLLPMSFSDFQVQLAANDLGPALLKQAQLFLDVGGFPFRVDEYIKSVKAESPWDSLNGFQVFDDVVFYEIGRRKLDRTIALEVFSRLSQVEANAVSMEGFSKPMTVSRDTAKKYIDALGDAFLLATISSFDTSRNRVAPKKDRKLFWVDPALGFLAAWLGQGDAASEAAKAEWAVGAELLRRYEKRIWEGLSAPRNVFTWKSSGGNEIDYLVLNRTEKIVLPVEVKYRQSISDWDFQVMERAFKKGLLVTKDFSKKRPLARALPLHEFLAMSDVDRDS
ncbi:MAG TPA: ATP-binding protein [Bdellovibrionota bacterium]|nr:ATP-binding protein [Bdellovibrionota bacterium]